jgi:hypothetical protein
LKKIEQRKSKVWRIKRQRDRNIKLEYLGWETKN